MADVVPHRIRPVPPAGVLALYRTQGWWPERTAEQVATVLGTGSAVGAWDGEVLVGFGRAVTDGVLRAYLEDIVVAPGYWRTGLGRRLVDALLAELGPVPVVSLFCAADLTPFYESAGFRTTRQVVLHRS
jgi:ribosomal protein S18 acetylase RimI-like enzyme